MGWGGNWIGLDEGKGKGREEREEGEGGKEKEDLVGGRGVHKVCTYSRWEVGIDSRDR